MITKHKTTRIDKNVDNTKELRVLSLCTGYGGIERGLELAGESLRTLAHVEIEAFAIANLVAKMEEGSLGPSPIWSNVKTLPLAPFRGVVDLLTGGYPCQPFSVAGRRGGKDDERHLWPWICRIIDGIMPRVCFFENVEGHISLGLRQVLADLEARGYKTAWGIFDAETEGASHRRKRVFIMADSNGKRLQRRWGHEESTGQAQSKFGSDGKALFPNWRGAPSYDWEDARYKPRVGGANDGYPHKLDRLRLLGNGVVPQTAARAWVTLNGELSNDH